jgi:hypothetical protein
MRSDYILGLDLGQSQDYTALAVLERPAPPARREKPTYSLRYLVRFPLGTPYTTIVPAVARLVSAAPLKGSPLVVDHTGVGRALVDMLKRASTGGRIVPVTVTAGHAVTHNEDGSFHVPKKELVTCLQLVLQGRRLKIARSLPHADTLGEELQNFRVKVTAAANEVFGCWREGQHDDLVFAVVLACWWAEKYPRLVLRPGDIVTPKVDPW